MVEKRRDVRYAARIVARIVRRNETVELLTNDVSFRGAFLRTDSPPAARQLVRVSFVLSPTKTVSAHAMVVRVVSVGDPGANVPGVGIQFWGPMDDAKAWEQFIYELKAKERAGMPAARATDKVRRASERFRLSLEVNLDGRTFVTRDVSLNGMAVRTDSPMPVGMRARMHVSAPGREPIALDVVVRRQIDEPGFRGLGVEFVDVPPETKAALVDFVRANAPAEDAQFVDPRDPRLH